MLQKISSLIVLVFVILSVKGQRVNDSTTPLHLLQPEYETIYGKSELVGILKVLESVYNYFEAVIPAQLIDKELGAEISDFKSITSETIFKPGDFRLISYK